MNQPSLHAIERLLASSAPEMKYPRTPDMAQHVRASLSVPRRPANLRLVRAVAIAAVVLLAVVAAVPEARALVAGWFRIGVIQVEPAPSASTPASETPGPTSLPQSLSGLSGFTTLEEVRRARRSPLPLPTYPPDLGDPDVVLLQPDLDMLVLVWLDPADRTRAHLALFEFPTGHPIVRKLAPKVLVETTVNGAPALWVEGPYPLQVTLGEFSWRRIVAGTSLLWERDGVTYRLETDLTLDEARRIAESIP